LLPLQKETGALAGGQIVDRDQRSICILHNLGHQCLINRLPLRCNRQGFAQTAYYLIRIPVCFVVCRAKNHALQGFSRTFECIEWIAREAAPIGDGNRQNNQCQRCDCHAAVESGPEEAATGR
jgi:hypothetical protein